MVLPKRLEYGFNDYQVSPVPHVPKSAKGKRSVRRKKTVENRMCAIDLLAAIAGKLLLEGEGSLGTIKMTGVCNACNLNVKREHIKPVKNEPFDMGSCTANTLGSQQEVRNDTELLSTFMVPAPTIIKSGICSGDMCTKRPSISTKKSNSFICESAVYKSDLEPCSLENKMVVDAKLLPLVSLEASVKVPLGNDSILHSRSYPKCREEKIAVDRDDDENSSGYTQPSFTTNKALKPRGLGEHMVSEQLANKLREVAPTMTKDVEMKPNFYRRKICYARQRTQRSLFKRRKFFQRYSISASVGGSKNRANRVSSANSGNMSSYEREDFHVKFSIKSFKVPELFIEIPENSTVASLKRTVMEAVTAILEGGLCIGVLVQGKKVRDDSKTLLQAGISNVDQMDDLGFTLEPNSSQASTMLASPEKRHLLPARGFTEPLARFPSMVLASDGMDFDVCPNSPLTPIMNCPESDHDSLHLPSYTFSLDKNTANARALIAIPSMNVEAPPMTPVRKPTRSELVQRRIRRPFSVSEVEALVEAVEKLGSGRWRDVKIRAFDNAKHRTCVDLKRKHSAEVHKLRRRKRSEMGKGILEVQLVDAKGLADTDAFGKSDPYVIIQYRNQERKSSVARGQGTSPMWNETFKFLVQYPGVEGQHKLTLRIMDEDTFSVDDSIGEATINVEDVISLGFENGIAEMHATKHRVVLADQSYCGEIRVGVKFTPKVEVDQGEEFGGWNRSFHS